MPRDWRGELRAVRKAVQQPPCVLPVRWPLLGGRWGPGPGLKLSLGKFLCHSVPRDSAGAIQALLAAEPLLQRSGSPRESSRLGLGLILLSAWAGVSYFSRFGVQC